MAAAYRLATLADAATLFDVRRRSILELAARGLPSGEAEAWVAKHTPARMERKLREFEIWIAEFDRGIAGWGAVGGDYLEGLYTAPEFAGRGVASSMLVRLEGLLRSRGVPAMRADASSNARDFYLRRGFRLTGPQEPAGTWPIEKQLQQACNAVFVEVFAEDSAISLNRLPRLIFPAQEATLAAEFDGAVASANAGFWRFGVADQVQDLTPQEVSKGIEEGRYLLVDVREPNEVAAEAYPSGVVVPLSTFDPADIPDPRGKQVVFACRSGKRSVTASLAAQAAGLPYDKHLAGGIIGWKAAGLPTKVGG